MVDFIPKVKVEIVVDGDIADKVVAAVMDSVKTGNIGDGKIFVQTLDSVIRIRTGETDKEAV